MQVQRAWLKPGVWGVVIGSILTMIVGFSWGGWTTSSTAYAVALKQAPGPRSSASSRPSRRPGNRQNS